MPICHKTQNIANIAITQQTQKTGVTMESIAIAGESIRGGRKEISYATKCNLG